MGEVNNYNSMLWYQHLYPVIAWRENFKMATFRFDTITEEKINDMDGNLILKSTIG